MAGICLKTHGRFGKNPAATGRKHTDYIITTVSYMNSPDIVHRHAEGIVKPSANTCTDIAPAFPSNANDRLNSPIWRDLSNRVIARIGHVNISVLVHRQPPRIAESRRRSHTILASWMASHPRHRCDNPVY